MKRAIGAGAAVLVIAGCGSTKLVTTTQTTTQTVTTTETKTRTIVKHVASSTSSTTAQAEAAQPSPQAGSTLTVHDFNGNTLAVKADGLIDPATATDPAVNGPQAGTRFVALELTLTSQGPGTISDDANSDTTLVGTDGQDYTPQFGAITECTNFNHGEYTLLDGDSQRGCVVFQLPTGVSVKSVQYSLGNGTVQFNK